MFPPFKRRGKDAKSAIIFAPVAAAGRLMRLRKLTYKSNNVETSIGIFMLLCNIDSNRRNLIYVHPQFFRKSSSQSINNETPPTQHGYHAGIGKGFGKTSHGGLNRGTPDHTACFGASTRELTQPPTRLCFWPSVLRNFCAFALLERDDIWPNRKGDSRIGGFLIQPAGWEEAGMDGKTLFYGPA